MAGLALALIGSACGGGNSLGETASGQDATPIHTDGPSAATATPRLDPTAPPSATVPVADPAARASVALPGCEAVTEESQYCLTLSGDTVAVLGLDSGQLCTLVSTTAPVSGGFTTSLAWRGDSVYTCADNGLVRISLRDGAWEEAHVPCLAVADHADGLLLMGDREDFQLLRRYADHAAVLAGRVERSYDFGAWATRMAVHGDRFYAAWHATDSIEVGDLATGEPLGVLTLARDDDWVFGLAVTGDGRLVLADGRDRVELFDVGTGEKLSQLHLTASIAGLACTSRHAPPPDVATPAPTPEPTPQPSPLPRPPSIPSCEDLAHQVSGPGRQVNFPPSDPQVGNCGPGGYVSSNYATDPASLPANADLELHVVGVYGGAAEPGFREQRLGTVQVNIRAGGKPIVLALAAYEPVLWRLDVEPGADLRRVIITGYAAQQVEGAPEGASIEYRDPAGVCAYAYGWEIWSGGDYPLMIADLRVYTGLVESSFQGCYAGVAFDVPYWDDVLPPTTAPTPLVLDESIPRRDVAFPGCESVTAERTYCLTNTDSELALVGLDSGAVCPLGIPSPGGSPSAASLAWRGEAAYLCAEDAGLIRISLRDGAREYAQVRCDAVTDYGGELLLLGAHSSAASEALLKYASYTALLAGAPTAAYDVGDGFSRMTVSGDLLYGAWHSTDTIEIVDLATATPRPPLILEGYDGWILGLAVTADGELVVSGDSWGDTIRIFDAVSGAALRELHPQTEVWGLACVTRD